METVAILFVICGVIFTSISKGIAGYIKSTSYVCFLVSFCMLIASKVSDFMDNVFWETTCLALLIFGTFIFYDLYRNAILEMKKKKGY